MSLSWPHFPSIDERMLSFLDIKGSGLPLDPFPLSKLVQIVHVSLDLVVITQWCIRVRVLPLSRSCTKRKLKLRHRMARSCGVELCPCTLIADPD